MRNAALLAIATCTQFLAPPAATLEPPPTASIDNVSHREGRRNTTLFAFTVSLSASPLAPADMSWATADRSAKTPSDYGQTGGTITINPGASEVQVMVEVNGDRRVERDERFVVVLSEPVNVTIEDGVGRGTIRNDD